VSAFTLIHHRNVEHVQVIFNAPKQYCGSSLTLTLTSPAGTRIPLNIVYDGLDLKPTYVDWPFMATSFWDEVPQGDWKLELNYIPAFQYASLYALTLLVLTIILGKPQMFLLVFAK
jgi:subtilisin-like proprotein convertase family protein